jgi:hypothetical protein
VQNNPKMTYLLKIGILWFFKVDWRAFFREKYGLRALGLLKFFILSKSIKKFIAGSLIFEIYQGM